MRTYEKIRVWQSAMDLVVLIYKATQDFPRSEQFGLVSQMRRASVTRMQDETFLASGIRPQAWGV